MNKSENILITGGSGFIGSHLAKYLKRLGYKNLTVIDIVPPKIKGVNFVKSDFSDSESISKILHNTDTVFHLAAMVGVDRCRLDPSGVRKTNGLKAMEFIDLCIDSGIKKFIFTSSSEVYGNSKELPFREDAHLEPISEYAKSKIRVEKYLKKIQAKSNMHIGIVRFFNVYGPGQRKDFVVSNFVDKARNDLPITILGSGKQTRCFTYIDDAIEGLYKLYEYDKKPYEIFNIGSGFEVTVKDLAALIIKKLPASRSKIVYERYGDKIRDASLEIDRRVPDVSKARKYLGFKAGTTVEKGITKMIRHAN